MRLEPRLRSTGAIRERCKFLFYFTQAWQEWRFRCLPWPEEGAAFYFGLSRCTILTLYPARRKCLPTSSAIMTERCCPPVQPKAIVR